jgi:hydrogenase/urease accessory protein HupE
MYSRSNLKHIYAIPLVLLIMSVAGLSLALLGDKLWDKASWILLSLTCFALFLRPIRRLFHK